MFTIDQAYSSLFAKNMGARKGERILVFSDTIRPGESVSPMDADRRKRLFDAACNAARFAERTYGSGIFVAFPSTSASGTEPPEILWRASFGDSIVDMLVSEGILEALISKQADPGQVTRAAQIVIAGRESVVDVVVAMSNNSTSHTRFRSLVNKAGGRFASLPHFDPEMFFTSMRVDWNLLAERTRGLAAKLNRAVGILVETDNGTRMSFEKRGREAAADVGLLTEPGSFGNLPAGEAYLAPVEGKSSGTMVLEFAPTRMLSAPLELVVKDGMVTEIRGDEPYRRYLEEKFNRNDLNRNIAELGIGTNDRATRPDNILEAEKILGTIHIALGDNSSFGGTVTTPFHEDFVFYGPTVTAVMPDGATELILNKGKLSE